MQSPLHLHTALTHLQLPNTYVRMLFVDFSSAFNTVIPDKLILTEAPQPGTALIAALCHWIRDSPHQQASGGENRGQHILSTDTPQGCVLSPALFTLFTSDCSTIHSTNTIVKFADDTTVVGLSWTIMRPTTERRLSTLLNGPRTTTVF
ncbi:hypothetical protein L3Q82_002487 [Scortum barcoo]|uniref:Uncharacterized protein n=1 Tax=Scortum barcoo TaxID=214431 RepID=A0ACB8VYT5_9TELE|nr:hypothetical protein L3Q82_002487 [Scortum barcoo]